MDQFLSQIFAVIHQIPYGQVSTYGQVAQLAGYPGYARHVGKALGNLPKGSKLPWHRVINSKGEISLKGTAYDRQKVKLEDEGIVVNLAGKVRLKDYQWQP
ncbi:methylated-DNA-protein-cysteine methyltransferase [Vibrio nigripulchritudo ATCC 27043]|uniref:MGMT family protein n=1 Tax=Vibrio nigripulchritudo TaxID=28173 RepID=UPI00021C0D8D|nr:MGMT family protein [Vibrio nigripulchritudo]EGU60654.1 methylated-DNA-protein-cysteine methyltransferase [Vibrio nigripulchritudo ATCC 27043]KJY80594.1 MGMT family protein [Vibrio nigripulchritudo]CCN68279.1 putative Methylated DNA-protein cysteine methyltransferase [Vibrio nigripulchritudo SFn118]